MAAAREAGLTAAILCFVFAVWPLVAFLGGSALSPLTGVAALATAHRSVPNLRFQFYMLALAAFVAFAAASAMWSPRPFVLVELSSLSIRSEVLRWGLLMAVGGALGVVGVPLPGVAQRWSFASRRSPWPSSS